MDYAARMADLTPLDASLLAADLTAHLDRLSTLDLAPLDSAADIERHRAGAEQLARTLLGYLLTSDAFAPVIEADDAVQEWEL